MHSPLNTSEIQEHQERVNGLNVYYHTTGDPSYQPILFLHGWGIRWYRMGPYAGIRHIMQELGRHFYVIAPELPGLIRSETPRIYEGYESYATVLHALLEKRGITKPVIVMGHSFGGIVAALYAKKYQDTTRELVLVNAVLRFEPDLQHTFLLHWWGKTYPKILSSSRTPKLIKKIVINSFFGTPFSFITDEEISRKRNMEDPLSYMYDMDYEFLRVPTLLVWGKKDKKIPLSSAQAVHDQLKQSKLITLKGGHSILYFRPKFVVHTIIENLHSTTEGIHLNGN